MVGSLSYHALYYAVLCCAKLCAHCILTHSIIQRDQWYSQIYKARLRLCICIIQSAGEIIVWILMFFCWFCFGFFKYACVCVCVNMFGVHIFDAENRRLYTHINKKYDMQVAGYLIIDTNSLVECKKSQRIYFSILFTASSTGFNNISKKNSIRPDLRTKVRISIYSKLLIMFIFS